MLNQTNTNISRYIILVLLLMLGCGERESTTVRASNVILVDDTLFGVGVTESSVIEKLGEPCGRYVDQQANEQMLMWSTIMNTVTRCMPTGMALIVKFKDDKSKGYYIGEWP